MELITQQGSNLSAIVSSRTAENLKQSIPPNTAAAYRSGLKSFRAWLDQENIPDTLPHSPVIVADYMSHLDAIGRALSTISRNMWVINRYHKIHGYEPPTGSAIVQHNRKGIINIRKNEKRPTTSTSKAPATVDILQAMLRFCDIETLSGLRDKAILLIGFSGAFRRSELVAIHVSDITITGPGADIKINSSKTDQHGQGEIISICRGSGYSCPVMALVSWLNQSGIKNGALFRRIRKGGQLQTAALSDRSVANIIKKFCFESGLNPVHYSGHSLRSGMLTSAAENGADLIQLSQHARHKNTNQTMHYIRHANRYKNNPTEGLL